MRCNSFVRTGFQGPSPSRNSLGGRILFQALVGPLVDWFGFETTTFVCRGLNWLAYAFALERILGRFGLGLLIQLLLVALFALPGNAQDLFGGEWIIQNFEPKTLAYAFVLFSFADLIDGRLVRASLLAAAGTWFHFLVGGWYALVMAGILLLQLRSGQSEGVSTRSIARSAVAYILPVIPLMIYLASGVLVGQPGEIDGYGLNNIYVYFRLPHHLGIFKDMAYFMHSHAAGVGLALLCLFFAQWRAGHIGAGPLRVLNDFNRIALLLALFWVVLAWVDHRFYDNAGGFMLTFYPFRMMALVKLLTMVHLAVWLKEGYELRDRPIRPGIMRFAGIVLLLTALAFGALENIRDALDYRQQSDHAALCKWLNANTPKGSTVLMLHRNNEERRRTYRMAERDAWAEYKFVPGGTQKLYTWYRRVTLQGALSNNPSRLPELLPDMEVDYVVSSLEVPPEALIGVLNERFGQGRFKVFEVIEEQRH